jgi:hypothetical protein
LACVGEGRYAELAPYVDQFVADMLRETPKLRAQILALQARCHLAVNDFTKAEKALREVQKMPPSIVPLEVWQSMLGAALLGQKQFAEAEDYLVKGYENLGSGDVDVRKNRFWLLSDAGNAIVRLYEEWGKPDRATKWSAQVADVLAQPSWLEARARLYEYAVAWREDDLGRDHLTTLAKMQNLATTRARLGRLDAAEAILVEVAQRFRDRVKTAKQDPPANKRDPDRKDSEDPYHYPRIIALNNLSEIAFENNHPEIGVSAALEILKIDRPKFMEKDKENKIGWADQLVTVAAHLLQFKQYAEVALEFVEINRRHFEKTKENQIAWAGELARVADYLLQYKQYAPAEPIAAECLTLRQKNLGLKDWRTCNAMSMRGEVLFRLKRPEEAEPLLLQGYEGLRDHEAEIPPAFRLLRLYQVVDRLVQLYEATGKPDKAAEYREKRPPPPEFGPDPHVIK